MKNKILPIITVIALVVLLFLTSCELYEKLNGAEVKYKKLIEGAEEYSFAATVVCTDTDGTKTVNLKCFYKDGAYAYVYSLEKVGDVLTYRELFKDNEYYQILENYNSLTIPFSNVGIGAGEYYLYPETSATSDKNLVYNLTSQLLVGSYATLLKTSVKETLNGKDVKKYSFTYEDDEYTYWFSDKYLEQFKLVDNGGAEYLVTYKDYCFENVDTAYFVKPQDVIGAYIESNFSFEEWVEILSGLSAIISDNAR